MGKRTVGIINNPHIVVLGVCNTDFEEFEADLPQAVRFRTLTYEQISSIQGKRNLLPYARIQRTVYEGPAPSSSD